MMAGVLVKRLNQSEKLRKKAALQGNGHSMRAIIGAELVQNVLHVRLYGLLGNEELLRDVPIAFSVP